MNNEQRVLDLYQGGLSFRRIARELGPPWSAWTAREVVVRAGVVPRAGPGSGAKKLTDERIADVLVDYAASKSATGTAAKFGVTRHTVLRYAREAGAPTQPRGGIRAYTHDAAFFDTYTPASCYWGGFLAADGALVLSRGAHRTQIMLGRKDREHLFQFARSAKSDNPVHDVMVDGHPESCFTICCRRWWAALHQRFNLEPRKSLILRPPPPMSRPLTWHFLRGYFDGDGTAGARSPRDHQGRVTQIAFGSGSHEFMVWVRDFLDSHHKLRDSNGRGTMFSLAISGPLMRNALKRMYAGSTPDTRLARKYELLRHLLDGPEEDL